MEKQIIDINTILHTKDGRKIGNAIVVGHKGYFFAIRTDYGNLVENLTEEKIHEMFYIAFENDPEQKSLQILCQCDHKHAVKKNIYL